MKRTPLKPLKETSKHSFFASFFAVISVLVLTSCSPSQAENRELKPIKLSPSASSEVSSDNDSRLRGEISDGFAELEIEDQVGDGSAVEIDEAKIGFEQGFIVISDHAGSIFGIVEINRHSIPVQVQLDYRVDSSQELYGQLFADNGDGKFNIKSDFQVIDHERELVIENFDYKLSKK